MELAGTTVDHIGILNLLPHRYPLLLVDRILEWEKDQRIRALKNVTINEPFFQGHFPGTPIMPGVLILEGMAQAGVVLAYLSTGDEFVGRLPYFAGMDAVRFRQPVVPGDQLVFSLAVQRRKAKLWKLAGQAFVQDKLVTEAELMAVFS
ncbi:MAG: 3-hydroxyacyl-ACP dehydratase FabZ [Thermodesulfobacteriota bacterium]